MCLMVSLPCQLLNNLLCPLSCFFIPLPSSIKSFFQPSPLPLSWCLHQSHLSQISWFLISFHCFETIPSYFCFSLYYNSLTSLPQDIFSELLSLKSLMIFHSFNHINIITSFQWNWITTVWIVLSSKPSTLTVSVISLNRTHVLISLNVISPSSGRDVINVIQWSQGQDVRHVTMVTRVMEMEVVFHVHMMNVVLQTQHSLKEQIVSHGRNVSQNAWSVHQGIILMIQLVHV